MQDNKGNWAIIGGDPIDTLMPPGTQNNPVIEDGEGNPDNEYIYLRSLDCITHFLSISKVPGKLR